MSKKVVSGDWHKINSKQSKLNVLAVRPTRQKKSKFV